jgi:hypothetical protein
VAATTVSRPWRGARAEGEAGPPPRLAAVGSLVFRRRGARSGISLIRCRRASLACTRLIIGPAAEHHKDLRGHDVCVRHRGAGVQPSQLPHGAQLPSSQRPFFFECRGNLFKSGVWSRCQLFGSCLGAGSELGRGHVAASLAIPIQTGRRTGVGSVGCGGCAD